MDENKISAYFRNLDRAFSLAHRASEDARIPQGTRFLLRQIAKEIWLSMGVDSGRLTEKVQHARLIASLPKEGN